MISGPGGGPTGMSSTPVGPGVPWCVDADGGAGARAGGPWRPAEVSFAGGYRTKGMSIFVLVWYAGYAVGNVAVRFFSSTDAE